MPLKDLRSLDPAALHLLPLGVGHAFTRTRFHTSVLLIAGGRTLLIDAPAPLRRVCFEAQKKSGFQLDIQDIDALYLTHLHADHSSGVEEFGFYKKFFAGGDRPGLFLHRALVGPLWNRLAASMTTDGVALGLEQFFDVHPFEDWDVMDCGIPGLALRPLPTEHFIPCYGFSATYKNVKLGYSSDTSFLPWMIEVFRDHDLILHECGAGVGHTAPADLLGLDEALRARIRVMHLSDDFDPAEVPLQPLEEGRLYRV